jgi:excisionase family DNA binding protein
MTTTESYLSVSQAAKKIGVSARLIYKLINSGSLTHIRVGHRIIIPKSELGNYLDRNRFVALK